MQKLPEHYLWLEFTYQTEISSEQATDSSHAVDEITCLIKFQQVDRDEDILTAGYMKLYYCNMAFALNHGLSAFWEVDNFSDIASWFIDKETDELREEIKEQVGEAFHDNILLGGEFVIYPEFRGRGLGEEALNGLVKHYDGKCGYFAFKSFPLQCEPVERSHRPFWFRERLRLNDLEQDRKKAQRSINKFYKKCGFAELKGDPNYFILNMWPV